MGTRGRVPRVNVTSTNIREVADLSRNLGKGKVNSEQLFLDGDVAGRYIDPQYCQGETPEGMLPVFQSRPLHSGEWRNYGGDDPMPDSGEPEIYFSSVIGKGYNGGLPVEFVPSLAEDLQYLKDNNLIIGLAIPPDITKADDYVSAAIVESKQLADETQSVMLRTGADNALNATDIGVQVGIGHTQVAVKDAVFSYSITTYYGDIPIETVVRKSDGTNVKLLVIMASTIAGTAATIAAYKANAGFAQIFDYLTGPLTKTMTKMAKGVDKIITSTAETLAGALLVAVASYVTMILVADMIWDMLQNPVSVPDGIFRYKNLIDGMYTFDDIKKSKYQLGFGDLFTGSSNFNSKFISPSRDWNTYSAPANDIQYPANEVSGAVVRKKYANFKFFPKCNQYDLMTPPPVITYKVELEALSGCRLSETKVTAFTVSVAPDKYAAPVFDVITPDGRASQKKVRVYRNSPVEFVNARFVDSVMLNHTEKSPGLFGKYYNMYVNTDGAQGSYANKDVPFTGNGLISTGLNLFTRYGTALGSGPYIAKFLQEQLGNLIKNPSFRLERQSEDPNDSTNLLRKYWNYGPAWQIRDGAIYRDAASSDIVGFYQQIGKLSSIGNSYFFFNIECNVDSGFLELDHTSWNGAIYNWLTNISEDPKKRVALSNYPTGMSLIGGKVRISAAGSYRVILRKKADDSSKIMGMVPSSDFTGNIKYISLQYLPAYKVDDSKRNATNAVSYYGQPTLYIDWVNAVLVSKSIEMTFKTNEASQEVSFSFFPSQAEKDDYSASIKWGDGTAETYDLSSYNPFPYTGLITLSHTYALPGYYSVKLTNTIPQLLLNNLYDNFTCNDPALIIYRDLNGLLSGGSVDLSDSGLGDGGANPPFIYYTNTAAFTTPLYSLDVSGTNLAGNCDKLASVTQFLDVSHTKMSGDLVSIYNTASINASNSQITTCYPSGQPIGADGNKTIIWQNQSIKEIDLYNLIKAIDLSSIEEGYLDIKGNNIAITDQDTLGRITMLTTILGQPDGLGGIGRGWTILYNSIIVDYFELIDSDEILVMDSENETIITT